MAHKTAACEAIADRALVEQYVAGRLTADQDLEFLEAHLLTCSDCREDVRLATALRAELKPDAAVRLHRSALRRGRAWWLVGTAAAAAVLVLVLGRDFNQRGATGPVLRAGNEGVPHVAIVSPVSGAVTPRDSLAFVWRSAGQDVAYKLTVTNEAGDVVWTAAGLDTVRRLPRDVRLTGGRSYFWYVDALLPDGRSAITAVQRFAVPR